MTADIIPMPEPLDHLGKRLDAAYERTQRGRDEWIEGSLELATILTEARARFSSNGAFSAWLGDGAHDHLGKNDRAALINFGADLKAARICFQETTRFSYQHLWEDVKSWFPLPQVRKTTSRPDLILEPPAQPVVEPKIEQPIAPKVETKPAAAEQTTTRYEAPAKSKLRDILKPKVAEILLTRFKSTRMFVLLCPEGKHQKSCVTLLNHLADRCVQPDYPQELFLVSTWTIRLLYPHLPQKLLDMMSANINNLAKTQHATLVETERLFMQAPEFGVTDPPLVAFNKANSIYNALVHARNGTSFDKSAIHKPTFAGDEGKPPVIIRGTQLWPAEEGAGYCYNDLRCACGLASDVVDTFGEPRDAPMTTKSLKLRHLLAWLPGGYNSTGSSVDGVLKALRDVVQAYSTNRSDVMRAPLPSMKKLDE